MRTTGVTGRRSPEKRPESRTDGRPIDAEMKLSSRCGTPLDKSLQSTTPLDKLFAEEEEAALAASGGKTNLVFKDYTDFSKINDGRETHDTGRVNTFKTPTSLHKKFDTPLRADKRWGLGDTHDLIEICEAGFAKSMRYLGREILRESREELAKAIACIQTETLKVKAVEQSSEAILAEVHGLIKQIHQVTTTESARLDFSNADLEPLAAYLDKGHIARNDAQRTMIQELESQLMSKVSQVRQDVVDLMQRHDKTEKVLIPQLREDVMRASQEISEVCQRSEAQLNKLVGMQESLVVDVAKTTEMERHVQSLGNQFSGTFESILDTRLLQVFGTQTVKVDFAQIISRVGMTERSVIGEIDCLGQEIAKIQQALHLDFAQVIDSAVLALGKKPDDPDKEPMSAKLRRGSIENSPAADGDADVGPNAHRRTLAAAAALTGARARKRVRQFYTQTDIVELVDAETMTDKSLMQKPKNKGNTLTPVLKKAMTEAKIGGPGKKVFADKEAMKQKARAAAIRPPYNVFDYYHKEGRLVFITKSKAFEVLTQLVIFVNSVWIWVDIDYNHSETLVDADPIFVVAENLFCFYFTSEITLRFLSFNGKYHCLFDGWFVFDAFLVGMMIFETWILTIILLISAGASDTGAVGNVSVFRLARLIKMLRISRLTRLLRAIPELVILMKGIGAASRSVVVFLTLWFIIIYVFAVLFRVATDESYLGEKYFSTIPDSMNTLLLDGLLPENHGILNEINEQNPLVWPIFMLFILLACITLMYMLVGVLVDVVSSIASSEKEGMATAAIANQLRDLVYEEGEDMNSSFTKQQFLKLITRSDITTALSAEGVDVVALLDSADVIFEDVEKSNTDGGGMDFTSLVEVVLNMRGANPATVKDMKEQLRVMKAVMQCGLKEMHTKLNTEFKDLKQSIMELKDNQEKEVSDSSDGEEVVLGIASQGAFDTTEPDSP